MRQTKATKSARTASNPPTRTRPLRYLEIAALIVLIPLAFYLWVAPTLAERSLAKASLPELIADSQHQPDNPRIFHYLGLRYQQAGDPGQALTAFSKAAQMDTSDEASWLGWAASSSALGKEDDAYHVLASFLKPHPESAPAHYALAVIYGHRHVHKAAWEEASTATKLKPRYADAWRLAGEEALQWGSIAAAEAAMRRAVTLRPSDWLSQMGLGNVLMAQEHGTAAIPCFQEAVRLAPNEAPTQLCLGRALLMQAHTPEEIEAARQSLQQAIKLQPDLAPAYPLLGQSYSRQGRWTEARSVLVRAQQIAPDNIDIVFALKTAYEHTGEHDLAARFARLHQTLREVELKKRALISHLAMAPNDIKARLDLARLCAAHGDYTDARNYYRSALARSADPEPIRHELAAFEDSYARNNRAGTVPSGASR